jgi:hypothetical protein
MIPRAASRGEAPVLPAVKRRRAQHIVEGILVAGALLIGASTGAAELRDIIPDQFRGTWASSWMHCTLGGESTLTIGERTVDFYESRGRVLAIAAAGDTDVALLVEVAGEGRTWLSAIQLELSVDRQTLMISFAGQRVERNRCDVQKPNV